MDFTQGFFAYLLDNQRLTSANPEKGRFRSFLLVSFKNYVANQRRSEGTLRRGGGHSLISLTPADFETARDLDPADYETPEVIYQREWALALLRRVRKRLEDECIKADKRTLFLLLEPHLVQNPQALPHAEIARQTGMTTAAIAMALHRLRRRYRDILRNEVAATVLDLDSVDNELSELIEILADHSKY
jgi:RNA polymerase sigma-70 factor (ECF subfamily)